MLHCLVCRATIAHANLGVDSCRACCVFYRRTVELKYHLVCTCGGKDVMRKDKVVSCRKCRFEKMKELVSRATSDEIRCVSKGDAKHVVHSIEQARDVLILPDIAAHKEDAISNSSESISELNDNQPSFIDHNRYFFSEPSSSKTPLINKMKDAYSTLCLVRKSCEFNGLHHLEMHEQLRNEDMTLRCARYSNMIPFSQLFFVGIMDFGRSAFPEFAKMSAEDCHHLVQTNFPLIQSLDGSYRSNHHFPDIDAVMTSYTTFVSDDTLDVFFNDCPSNLNKDEAIETFRANMDRSIKSTKFQFGRVKPSINEFVALFGLALWNDCTSTLSMETSDIVYKIRNQIMKELHVMYSRSGRVKYATRIGELFCLLANEEACVQFPAKYTTAEINHS